MSVSSFNHPTKVNDMKMKLTISLSLAVLGAAVGPALATEFHAGTAQELQTSLTLAASNGEDDTIFLAAGIYNGNFTFNTTEAQSLTIKAETNTLPGEVVLDGLNAGATLWLSAGTAIANISVAGITIRNASDNGLYVATKGSIDSRNCTIRDCAYGFSFSGASSVNCSGSWIVNNRYQAGGVSSVTSAVFSQNSFQSNNVNGWNSSLPVSATTISFLNNIVSDSCGGLAANGTTLTIADNVFQRNRTPYNGPSGGALSVNGSTSTLLRNRFVKNRAENTYNENNSYGGAVSCSSTFLTLQGNEFFMNYANRNGGAIYVGSGTTFIFANNLVISNSSAGMYGQQGGGGIFTYYVSTNLILNNTFYGNASLNGGGIYLDTGGTSSTTRNYVYNNIIWGNTATNSGGDVYVVSGGALRSLYNNNYHSMGGLWDVALNNIDVAPLFVDALRGDYHLRANSLCLNSGNNAAPGLPVVDKDGNARIGNGVVDMGCYEHDSTDKHPADANNNWVITSQEFTNYAKAWTTNGAWATGPNPIPMDYVTRAGFLFQTNSGTYQNLGGGKPLNWKP